MTYSEFDIENSTYFEVDIEYTSQAKMILLGEDEDDIRHVLATEFPDIPNMKILSVQPADAEMVKEAKARRAFEEAVEQKQKEQLN